MKKDWKLLVVSLISAIGALTIFLAGSDRYAAQAAPGATSATQLSNGIFSVSTTFSTNASDATVTANLPAGGSVTTIGSLSCSPAICSGSSFGNSATIIFDFSNSVATSVSVNLQFQIVCPAGASVSFTSTQEGVQTTSNAIPCSGTTTGGQFVISVPSTVIACASNVGLSLATPSGAFLADGTPISLSASSGTVPSTVVTTGGTGIFTFTAPTAGANTSAIITATGGGFTGTANVVLSPCTPAGIGPLITVPPAAPPPLPPPAVPAPIGAISPPRTGDGGLQSGANATETLAAGVVLLAGSLLTGVAGLGFARKRS